MSSSAIGYVIVRSTLFTALLVLVGVGAFQYILLPLVRRRGSRAGLALADRAHRQANGVALIAAAILLVTVVARLIARITTTDQPHYTTPVSAVLFDTVWGWGWLLQLAATSLALACYAVRHMRRGQEGTLLAVLALALAITPALSGHAVEPESFSLSAIVAGSLHVVGASGWLGTLTVILFAGIPAARQLDPEDRGPAIAEMIHTFSPIALAGAALVLATGTFVGWQHLGTVELLVGSTYGRWLLIKLGLLVLVTGIGAYNWRRVRPALGNDLGTQRLQRYAATELILAVLVVAATAVLVAVPLPDLSSAAAAALVAH